MAEAPEAQHVGSVIVMRWFAAVLLVVASLVLAPIQVGAQDADEPAPTTLPRSSGGVGSILGPGPGGGVEPTDSGDRGGAAQLALFGVLVVAIGGIALLARRDMGKAKRAAAAQE